LHCVAYCCCCCRCRWWCCADPAEHAWIRLSSAHLWLHPWLLAAPSFRRLSSRLEGGTLIEPRGPSSMPSSRCWEGAPAAAQQLQTTAWTSIMATPINLQVQLLAVIHTASCTRRNQLPKHRLWRKYRLVQSLHTWKRRTKALG